MKIAYTTLACPDWTIEQCAQAARDYGYDEIELRLLDGAILQPGADLARIRAACAGVPIICVDTSVSLAQPDETARAKQIADGKAMINMAVALNSPYIRVFGSPPRILGWKTPLPQHASPWPRWPSMAQRVAYACCWRRTIRFVTALM